MKPDRESIYPLFVWAAVFISQCVWAINLLTIVPTNSVRFYIFILLATWYLASGLGVFLAKKWGLKLLRINMGITLLAFPIGTYLSIKTTKYIKENGIEQLFN